MEIILSQNDANLFLCLDKINQELRGCGKIKFIVGHLLVIGQRNEKGINSFEYRFVGEPWLDDVKRDKGVSFFTPIDEYVLCLLIMKNGVNFCSTLSTLPSSNSLNNNTRK